MSSDLISKRHTHGSQNMVVVLWGAWFSRIAEHLDVFVVSVKMTLLKLAVLPLLLLAHSTIGQLGLPNGFLTFTTSSFNVQLVKDSQTLYSLKPRTGGGPDFIPADKMTQRQNNRQYHLGDITFRARTVGSSAWVSGDSAASRRAVTAHTVSGNTLASANLGPTLPSNSLLNITRRWVVDGDQFELLFDVTNSQSTAVEIGALGAPLEFNNIFSDRDAAATNTLCSLFDPYTGQDAGYVQVTPLLGTLPPLVVLPVGKSPLEGWRFLPESTSGAPYYQSQTFEGLYEWQFHTLAYAQNEWSQVTPWNAPTSATLQPGQTRTYGLQFRLASSIRGIEQTIQAANRPVAVTVPGTILPTDQTGKLFLHAPSTVQSISVSPSGALSWATNSEAKSAGWVGYSITANTWGRARLSITYADGSVQTVHYYVTKAATQTLGDLGNFLTTTQWYTNTADPFKRAPSVISYDREVNSVWISGLEDEGGAGSWLAALMKQFAQPNAAEVTKLQQFIAQTLSKTIQNSDGSVKKSVFFYEPSRVPGYSYPSSVNWGNWWSWNQAAAFATDRAYDYVHVIAGYWAMYRVARNYPSLVTTQNWQYYLTQAVTTVNAMTNGRVGYVNDGLMGETVIRLLLDDLKREGRTSDATTVENKMRSRWQGWSRQRYPFGSEMAWDSTGQEGVYAWSKYFNDATTASNTLSSILAYQPTVPHWGYNGNARRYWDNVYGGKLQRIERQIHHYGSGLNALPLISAFMSAPTDYYLLRVGFGGLSGPLSNIDQSGFASASFHSFADTLKWDGYSGDYGPNLSGHTMGMGTFIINHPDFGWQAFGGNVISTSPAVQVQIRDSVRRRVFIAPIGALLTLDAGAFSVVSYNPSAKTVDVTITAAPDGVTGAASAPNGRLVISQTASVGGVGVLKPTTSLNQDAGAYTIPLSGGTGKVTLSA
uniref:Glycoside hydrolase family 43 protein n=1 Tax=Moniliophthora roreri TaxID=221103 RepID=A0A0W0FFJ9_MONRR